MKTRLSEISITNDENAIVVSGNRMLDKETKEPYGYVVEVLISEKDECGINKTIPVFLPLNESKIRQLKQAVMSTSIFMVIVTFENLQLHKAKSGSYFGIATDFNIGGNEA